MALIDDIKNELRINGSAFNTEVSDLISTAKLDLKLAGLLESKINDSTDPLIKRAIALYCKANFGMFNTDVSEAHAKSYYYLKTSLLLSVDYTVEVDGE